MTGRYVDVILSEDMLAAAREAVATVQVHRTQASPIDTLAGICGELAFGEWFLGDWRRHDLLNTKGKADFLDRIEVKTSAFPFSDRLNLLVREDYAAARKPEAYVQVILDVPEPYVRDLAPGLTCRLSGWATSPEVDAAPLRDFGAKGGGRGGYLCHHIAIRGLQPMATFPVPRPASSSMDGAASI